MSIPDNMPMLYLDGIYNIHKEKLFLFGLPNIAANDQDVSFNMDYFDDHPKPLSARDLRFPKLLILIIIAVVLSLISYIYKHKIFPVSPKHQSYTVTELQQGNLKKRREFAPQINQIPSTEPKSLKLESLEPENPDTATFTPDMATELEQIAYRVISSNHWRSDDIHRFSQLWELLDKELQSDIVRSVWYQHLSFKLKRETKILIKEKENNDPRVALAQSLGLVGIENSLISNQELETNISDFVKAYESGNIWAMDKLFANNVVSNTGTTKSDLREEFLDLFSSSVKRNITINNLRWEIMKTHAKVTGKIKIVTVSYNNEVETRLGKIRFIMKKSNNELLVTHFYKLMH